MGLSAGTCLGERVSEAARTDKVDALSQSKVYQLLNKQPVDLIRGRNLPALPANSRIIYQPNPNISENHQHT